MGKGYGQFCPVAKAAELICDRWTPLVLRELMNGSRHFNELAAGVPLMSRSLLTQRLRALEDAKVIVSAPKLGGRGREYLLTPAGDAIRPIIEKLGMWSLCWTDGDIDPNDIDDAYLSYTLRRILRSTVVGHDRVTLRIDFHGLKKSRVARRSWWLLVNADDVDVCLKDPGFEVTAVITADLTTYIRVYLGHLPLANALRSGQMRLEGPADIVRKLPRWLLLDGSIKQGLGIDHAAAKPAPTSQPVARLRTPAHETQTLDAA
jgi:DNA-binding HxlR family transcriptional regulator